MKILRIAIVLILSIVILSGCTIELNGKTDINIEESIDVLTDKIENAVNKHSSSLNFYESEEFNKTINSKIDEIDMKNLVGEIEIVKSDSEHIEIAYEKKVKTLKDISRDNALETIKVDITEKDNKLKIDVNVDKDITRLFETRVVDFKIKVPSKMKDIYISNNVGKVSIRDLEVGGLKTNLSVGNLVLENLKIEDAYLASSTGSIQITNSNLKGEIKTSTGRIDLENGQLLGPTYISTSTGSIKLDCGLEDGGKYDFSSSTGSINLTLDKDYGFEVDARTATGSIKSDFNLSNVSSKKNTLQGTHLSGEGHLKLNTSTGSITIYKN